MKKTAFLAFITFGLGILCLPLKTYGLGNTIEDPVVVAKKIISDDPIPWTKTEYEVILKTVGAKRTLTNIDKNYLLLQSPWLGVEYLQGVYGDGVNSIPVEQLLDLLNMATNSPQQTSRKLAEVTLQHALLEYDKAFNVATNISSNSAVSYEDAISFLTRRFGYLKISTAKKLLDESSMADNAVIDKKTNRRIADHFKNIRKQYSEEIPIASALQEIKAFYTLLEEVVSGLAMVKPYTNFTQTITELNEVQLQERKHWRSGLEITFPTNGTVWTIPDPGSIEWTTSNLPPEKTIKFYLLKNNTVIQELGTYKNTKLAGGIKLNKTLPNGNNYRIMGIELFPTDKFYTAKFATPYFTINKRNPDATPPPELIAVVEEEVVPIPDEPKPLEIVEPAPPKEEPSAPEEEIIVEAEEVVEQEETPVVEIVEPVVIKEEVPEKPVEIEKRTDFDGRTITYVKELEVNNKIIQINLWDHGRQDGDIVSIYLNGFAIVSQYNLTYQKKGFELKLDPTQANDLFLYAHNLGKFPPNTVSIEIIDGDNSENIILNSDLSRCEAVLINVKE
ncbi:hypothetical protein [uncultured Muriicola sp.]|uniref:hypothetical protein n=1 Tax=uncultured Muriicola sp. TaxID=1583102 RepID=UPI00260B4325|nr:hypothetical protein [uncultured Muriicola sp.]